MISYIRGTLAEVLGDTVVVEAGQVGVNIRVPLTVTEQLPRIGEEVLIYTYLKVSEDALTLFGFLTRRDLDLFRRLITVNGIGPKGALGILSVLSADDLILAVVTNDAKAIARAPGLGQNGALPWKLWKHWCSWGTVPRKPARQSAVSGTRRTWTARHS